MIGRLVESARPTMLREYDQIAMERSDLVRQARSIAPHLADRRVVLIGDDDGTSLVLGLLAVHGGPAPSKVLLLDFDHRLLTVAQQFAAEHGFGHLLEVRPYNVLDPLPVELQGQFDWFYTNPPYGSRNEGQSARIFLSRALELTAGRAGFGCVILPCDVSRPWTVAAWRRTEKFFAEHGWQVTEKRDSVHRYHLDDDPELTSSSILVRRTRLSDVRRLPFQGRRVPMGDIQDFYGSQCRPPFARYILADGSQDFEWDPSERQIA